jgi:hypothetical protein
VRDEIDRLLAAGGHGRVILPLGRFVALQEAVDEYVETRTDRDWLRKADEEALPMLSAVLGPWPRCAPTPSRRRSARTPRRTDH